MDGVGYQVDTGTVHGAGHAAEEIGGNIAELAVAVTPASDVAPAPAGMDLGSALLDVVPVWEEQLVAVGGEVRRTGQNLSTASANYAKADAAAGQSFGAIQGQLS